MTRPIDIHTHWCRFGLPSAPALAQFERLERAGFAAVAVFPLPGMGAAPERVMELIPGSYRTRVGLDPDRAARCDLACWRAFQRTWAERPRSLELLSFLDLRAWDGVADLAPWWGPGHAGLKGILVTEADAAEMAMPPLRHVQGLPPRAYLDAQRALFAAAARRGVPLVYHADLRHHGGFVAECLEEHPELRVDVPHCGFSRREMAELLGRFPNLVTDLSSLGPHLARAPESYRRFIQDHPRQVLLGSDALAGHDLGPALTHAQQVRSLGLPGELRDAVLAGNARRFLGRDAPPE